MKNIQNEFELNLVRDIYSAETLDDILNWPLFHKKIEELKYFTHINLETDDGIEKILRYGALKYLSTEKKQQIKAQLIANRCELLKCVSFSSLCLFLQHTIAVLHTGKSLYDLAVVIWQNLKNAKNRNNIIVFDSRLGRDAVCRILADCGFEINVLEKNIIEICKNDKSQEQLEKVTLILQIIILFAQTTKALYNLAEIIARIVSLI